MPLTKLTKFMCTAAILHVIYTHSHKTKHTRKKGNGDQSTNTTIALK